MSNSISHGEHMLFDCPRVRKSEYWQFIKLVAPQGSPPEGQSHWLSQDSTDAYCLKCSKMFRFTKGSSNSVRRHMERFHRKELLKRQLQGMEAKKGTTSLTNKRAATAATSGSATRKTKRRSMQDIEEQLLAVETGVGGAAALFDAADSGATDAAGALIAHHTPKRPHRMEGVVRRDPRHGVEALVTWLVLSMRPLSLTEDAGFALFAESLSTESAPFVVPTRDVLHHRLDLMSENARFEIKQKIKKGVGYFALSADTWRARLSEFDAATTDTHVALKCGYLSEEFVPQSCVLEVLPLDCVSSDKLLQLLPEFGLHKSSLSLFFVPESGKLEQKVAAAGLRSVVDVATTLSGLVETTLQPATVHQMFPGKRREALEAIQAGLSDVMEAIKWVRTDSSAQEKYRRLYPSSHLELLRLATLEPCASWSLATGHDAVTRMLALRSSLDGLVDQWGDDATDAVDAAAAAEMMETVKPEVWMLLEGLVVLWRPLYEVFQVARNEKVCSLPFILPILTMAKQHFEREDLFVDLKDRYTSTIEHSEERIGSVVLSLEMVRTELLRGLNDQFEPLHSSLAWTSALDPRYGRLRHLSDRERDICKDQLLQEATDRFTSHLPSAAPPSSTEALGALAAPDFEGDTMYSGDTRTPSPGAGPGSSAGPGPIVPGFMNRLLFDEDDEATAPTDVVLNRETEVAQARLFIANEIALYFSEHQLRKTRIACPLEWWSANRERYPFLASLARIWLSTRVCGWPSPPPNPRVLSFELCESLGSKKQDQQQWMKVAGEMILLQTHLQTGVPIGTGSVSL